MGTVDKIKAALKITSVSRGAKPDQLTLTVYSNRLAQLSEQDVLAALQKLSERKREEYEPALPELGAMVALVDVEKIARENRSTAKKSERLVRWQCPECKVTVSGFPSITADIANKRCQSKYKPFERGERNHDSLPQGQICGARMVVIHDDAEAEAESQMVKWDMPWAERSGAR